MPARRGAPVTPVREKEPVRRTAQSLIGTGTITIKTTYGLVVLAHGFYIPDLIANLLSIKTSMRNGVDILFLCDTDKVYCTKNNEVICTASPSASLLLLDQHGAHKPHNMSHKVLAPHRNKGVS